MKILLMHMDPKVCELIESNNQQERRIDALSAQIDRLNVIVQKMQDDNQRKKSMEY